MIQGNVDTSAAHSLSGTAQMEIDKLFVQLTQTPSGESVLFGSNGQIRQGHRRLAAASMMPPPSLPVASEADNGAPAQPSGSRLLDLNAMAAASASVARLEVNGGDAS